MDAKGARHRHRTWVALGAVSAVAVTVALSPLSRSATPVPDGPVSPHGGVYTIDGRGHGHGRGMSQWGAQGAATKGIGYRQILSTYYPGTGLGSGSDSSPIQVWISDDSDDELRVASSAGLTLASGNQVLRLPSLLADKTVTRWRVRLVNGVPFADGLGSDLVWRSLNMPAGSPVEFRPGSSGTVRVVLPTGAMRDYRGDIQAVPTGSKLRTVNETTMGNYLRSVVPTEMPAEWLPAALNAQAVAARTYALWKTRYDNRGFADICDTNSCQAYRGVRSLSAAGSVTRTWETAKTDAAVTATAGQWLSYNGKPALTEFSSSNGGRSVYGDFPYLPARQDLWDGAVKNPEHAWTVTLPATKISNRWPQIGKVQFLQVLSRDGKGTWGGRVISILVVGTKRSITLTGSAFVNEMGLQHRWFNLR